MSEKTGKRRNEQPKIRKEHWKPKVILTSGHEPKQRTGLDIIAEILAAVGDGSNKATVMHEVRIRDPVMKKYMTLMLEAELIREVRKNGKIQYITTDIGLDFLRNYFEFRDLIRVKTITTKMSDRCPFCNASTSSRFKFCPQCGKRLFVVKQRKS